jgi:mono/diheme cytochrome c family protein
MRFLLLPFALVANLLMSGPTQVPRPPAPPEFFKSTDGQEVFKFYCANCHGMDARGRPATPAMRTASTDLTRLAERNGGAFPRERVIDVLKRGPAASPSHGTKDMPIWGPIFRSMETDSIAVEIRIENLVRYLEALQQLHRGLGAE